MSLWVSGSSGGVNRCIKGYMYILLITPFRLATSPICREVAVPCSRFSSFCELRWKCVEIAMS